MKKRNLIIILCSLATLLLACRDTDDTKDTLYNCKITGKVCIVDEDGVTLLIQGIEVKLTPKNGKMQYYKTVTTDDKGVFQFDEAYKGVEYKLTSSGNIKDHGLYAGETDFFTVSKDQLIEKDIVMQKK